MSIVLKLAQGREEEIPETSIILIEGVDKEDIEQEGRVYFTLDGNTFYTRFIFEDFDELITATSHLRLVVANSPDGDPVRFDPAYLAAILNTEDNKTQIVLGKGGAMLHANVIETRKQLREAIDKLNAPDVPLTPASTAIVEHAPKPGNIRKRKKPNGN